MALTKEQFKAWAIGKGWSEDRYGNLIKKMAAKDGEERLYRFKLNKYSVRREVQCIHEASEYSPRSTSWVRLKSGYYKNLSIIDDKLAGLSRNGCGEPLRNPEASA